MQTLMEVYADLLLNQCRNKSLHISFDFESFELVEVLEERAHKIGIKDVYLEIDDDMIDLDSLSMMDSHAALSKISFNNYALKNADFMIVKTKNKVDADSLYAREAYRREKCKIYYDKLNKGELNIIYGITPNKVWAREKYPDQFRSYEKLYQLIIDNYDNIPCHQMIAKIDGIVDNMKVKK